MFERYSFFFLRLSGEFGPGISIKMKEISALLVSRKRSSCLERYGDSLFYTLQN